MIIELAAPASLPLGIAQIDGHPAILALTVQHPPVHLEAQTKKGGQITGPRAHIAHACATRYLGLTPLDTEIEIELAIPANMGLGSDTMLGLSLAQALAWAHELPTPDVDESARTLAIPPIHAGEIAGYARGGLLLVGIDSARDQIIRRAEITHSERDAWAFVFHLPFPPDDTPESLETDRMQTLVNAAGHLLPGSSDIIEALFEAVADDDIAAFGHGLMALQQANLDALKKSSAPVTFTPEDRKILALMEEGGAVAWGQSLSGYCLWGLIKGGDPSRTLRKTISEHVGIFGGRVMATITDNRGARFIKKKGQLGIQNPIHPRTG